VEDDVSKHQTSTATDGLIGPTWLAVGICGLTVAGGAQPTVTFTPEGRFQGTGGINRFNGSYRVEGDVIEFGPAMSTRMAGPNDVMRQENLFLAVLAGDRHYVLADGVLTIGEGMQSVRLSCDPPRDEATTAPDRFEVTGEVTYREPVSLPPGAQVVVRLLDVSRADAASVTLAEQLIEPDHEVPISFCLTTARSELEPRKTYSVSARIIADGRLAWISDAHHPITIDSARDLELVLIAVPEGHQPG
jgi:putative lipoprotein